MLDSINEKTKSIIQVWKKLCGSIAPDVYTELSKTSFEMIEVMTEKLSLWKDKSLDTGDNDKTRFSGISDKEVTIHV